MELPSQEQRTTAGTGARSSTDCICQAGFGQNASIPKMVQGRREGLEVKVRECGLDLMRRLQVRL